MYVCLLACMHAYMRTDARNVFICVCACNCAYLLECLCAHGRAHVCVRVCVCVCVRVCARMCVCALSSACFWLLLCDFACPCQCEVLACCCHTKKIHLADEQCQAPDTEKARGEILLPLRSKSSLYLACGCQMLSGACCCLMVCIVVRCVLSTSVCARCVSALLLLCVVVTIEVLPSVMFRAHLRVSLLL